MAQERQETPFIPQTVSLSTCKMSILTTIRKPFYLLPSNSGNTATFTSIFTSSQWGGITLRHDYSYVSIKDYLYLNFEFYWEDPSSDFGLEVRVKTEGEEWTVPIAVGNFTR